MPYSRPGPGVYVTNGQTALTHGQAVASGNFVGVAVKQKVRSWKDGYAVQKTIDASEPYYILTKGVVQVTSAATAIASSAQGDAVYIDSSNNLTPASSGGNLKFGRIVSVAGDRGTPTGKCRIDLDLKSSF